MNPITRLLTWPGRYALGKMLDLAFGEEEELNYVSTTEPPPPPYVPPEVWAGVDWGASDGDQRVICLFYNLPGTPEEFADAVCEAMDEDDWEVP